jgi:hypothetical protein
VNGSLLFAAFLIAVQSASGWYVWSLIRRGRASLSESLGMGLALGTATAALSGIMLWEAFGTWAWMAPTLLALIAAVVIRLRTGYFFGTSLNGQGFAFSLPAAVAALIGLLLGGLSLLANLTNYPLKWSGLLTTYHPDMLFFEALSTSLVRFGPNDSIFMAGADLRYHWLVYAWSGQIAESAGTDPFVVLTRVLPVTAMVGAILIAIGWTSRLTRNPWAPSIAVALIISGGYVGATYGTILNFDSPSQQLATVWLLGLSISLWQSVKGRNYLSTRSLTRSGLLLGVIFVLAAGTSLGKASSGVVALAAWGLVALVALVRREGWASRAWVTFLVGSLASLWVYFDFIAGSAEGGGLGLGSLLNKASSVQGLNPTDYWWGIVVGTGLLILAMSARWIGLIWLGASQSSRWKPITVYGIGLVAASVGTVALISGGLNETWFALAASAPLAIISAAGVGRALESTSLTHGWALSRQAVLALLAALVLSVLVLVLWSFGPGEDVFLRWLAPIAAFAGALIIAGLISRNSHPRRKRFAQTLALFMLILIVMASGARVLSIGAGSFGVQPENGLRPTEFQPATPFLQAIDLTPLTAWTDTQADAGRWLKENSGSSDLIATNITFSPLVPALSGRQTFISGISHQAPYGRTSLLDEVLKREQISFDFINQPSAVTYGPLCSIGVDWIWVDRARTLATEWSPFANLALETPDTLILRTNPEAC